MYSCTIESQAFSQLPIEVRRKLVTALCEALVAINVDWLLACNALGFAVPGIYDSGVVYTDQVPVVDPFDSQEHTDRWQDIPRLLETGAGACEDLASWRVAELQVQGEPAIIDVTSAEDANGNILYHVCVTRGDGSHEDPSARLGMPVPLADIY